MDMDENLIITKIRNARVAKSLTQEQLAKDLGINRATYLNIESGKRKLNIDELITICDKLNISVSDLTKSIDDETIKYNEDKFKQIYYYVLKNYFQDGVPKTKLAKLLYLIDFTNYYEHHRSISGAKYYKLTYGPVAEKYFELTDTLFESGKINIAINGDAQIISISTTNEDVDPGIFDSDEKNIINKICEYWKDKRTSEIVNFTHSQKPWKSRKDGEYVPYDSIMGEQGNHIYAPLS